MDVFTQGRWNGIHDNPKSPASQARRPVALVRELSPRGGTARPEVILEVRTALDFLVSLVGDTESELLPVDAAWHATASDSLSAVIAARQGTARSGTRSRRRASPAVALIPSSSRSATCGQRADVVAFAGTVTAHGPDRLHVRRRGAGGDPGAGRPVFRGRDGRAATRSLPAPRRGSVPPWTGSCASRRPSSGRCVASCAHGRSGSGGGAAGAQMQARDVAARHADLGLLSLEELHRAGHERLSMDARCRIRRVYLVPSYFARPYNYVFAVTPGRCSPTRWPRRHSTGTRPRCRRRRSGSSGRWATTAGCGSSAFLADGDLYLTEIAERMGLLQADGEAPSRAASGGRARDRDRDRRADLLPPATRTASRRLAPTSPANSAPPPG